MQIRDVKPHEEKRPGSKQNWKSEIETIQEVKELKRICSEAESSRITNG